MTSPVPFDFACTGCGRRSPASLFDLESDCCGLPFAVEYCSAPLAGTPRLPLVSGTPSVSLGEGHTPLVELRHTAAALGLSHLWAKLEFLSPTGSFKDRGSAVVVSAAAEGGIAEFVEDSSGNAGASLAAYAAAAGLKAHVFVPASAARGKFDQISVFGASLHPIGGLRQAATDAAREYATGMGLPYLSHNLSPYFGEGMKSFAYEVLDSAAREAHHALFPVGNGSLLVGAWRGYREAGAVAGVNTGLPTGREAHGPASPSSARAMPRLHAVQSAGVSPIVAALSGIEPPPPRPTVAGGIAVSRPPRLRQVVEAVRSSGGSAVAAGDPAILAWQRRLASSEGIFCEPTSAAVFAGLEELVRRGQIATDESVIVPVTGSGLKEPLQPA